MLYLYTHCTCIHNLQVLYESSSEEEEEEREGEGGEEGEGAGGDRRRGKGRKGARKEGEGGGLVDVEDIGKVFVMRGQRRRKEGEEEGGSGELREMVTPLIRKSLTKQGEAESLYVYMYFVSIAELTRWVGREVHVHLVCTCRNFRRAKGLCVTVHPKGCG